ncbi:ComF family protein [Halieaceae bacterium IMCC14734]|uniref:ComF family protein n=1 Tax=Candidatus Litorirhabdus singularis TaxID=2518993 RepID=A0ABT3TBT9_9GAMM|nr:ComF family protein [Candidatus Litorirhabdus singularis]MCX2979761.1 ComF family protein [Candidatus Litorirhabdus singularis]
MVNKLWRACLRHIAPCECQFCGQPSQRDVALCSNCQSDLPANRGGCPICAEPLALSAHNPHPQSSLQAQPCGRCQQSTPPYQQALAPWLYRYPVDDLIKQLKYQRRLDHLPTLAALLQKDITASLEQHGRPDRLLPVPLHWRRLWRRGFNQAELLALQLTKDPELRPWQLRIDAQLCRRPQPTPALEGLDRAERARCMRAAFTTRARIDGEYVVIVDDVMTSGATATALSRVLLAQGARRVDVWCCARTAVQ